MDAVTYPDDKLVEFIIIVVLQYQRTLSGTTKGFESLLNENEVMKSLVSDIGRNMMEARRSEKDFLLRFDMKYPDRVKEKVADIQTVFVPFCTF